MSLPFFLNKIWKEVFYYVLIFSILISGYLYISACGKKGDPTLKSYEKPVSPSNLKAIHRESEIILIWEFPEDKEQTIKSFHLLKSKDHGFKQIAIIERDRRTYVDNNFQVGKEYKYKLYSQSLKGIFSSESNTLSVIPLETPPPPEKISYEIENDSLIIKWENINEEFFYNVYKSHKKGNFGLNPINREPLQETFFRDNLDTDRIVYYTVRSLREDSIRHEGKSSIEIKIDPSTLIPSKPEGLQAIAKDDSVYLIWKEPPEPWISGYKIYRKNESDDDYVFIGKTQIPTFVDKDKPLSRRNYRVAALGPVREGPFAEVKDIISIPIDPKMQLE